MSIRIGSNIASLGAQRQLADNSGRLSKTMERLSSGQRINRAADDAAGLSIAQKLSVDSRVFGQAMRNVNDGISYLNIADGALRELSNITTRQLELAQQAANGLYTLAQRKALNAEANALVKEYNRILESSEYNGRTIFGTDPSEEALRIQSGYGAEGGVSFHVADELSRSVGSGEFATAVTYSSSADWGEKVALADLDGDGVLDLITADYEGSEGVVKVWMNQGNGNFDAPVLFQSGLMYASQLQIEDVNGDERADIITASSEGFSILTNDGSGAFSAPAVFTGASADKITVADFNNDGALDIAGTIGSSGEIYLNDGHGQFSVASTFATGGVAIASPLVASDFNGDGAVDFAVATPTLGPFQVIQVWNNQGGGTFSQTASYLFDSGAISWIESGDLNGDGAADLVIGGAGGGFEVRLNDGAGTFGAAASYLGGEVEGRLVDMNGDGAKDIVATSSNWSLFINNGNGGFTERWVGGQSAVSVAAGDVNGDGAIDIATNSTIGEANIFLAIPERVVSIAVLDLHSRESALQALTALGLQQSRISAERGAIGSSQSRLEVILSTLHATKENTEGACSRIMDADVAQEAAESVRLQILQNIGASILGQSNQQPAIALSLLHG